MCVASAMSRCAHIFGLLHLLLNKATCPPCHQTDAELQSDVPCTVSQRAGAREKRESIPLNVSMRPNMGPIKGEK